MYDFQKLKAKLQEFKKLSGNELKFRPIEKWMTEELGIERRPNTGGSHVSFRHRALEEQNDTGNFQIGLKKNKKLYRENFRTFLYPILVQIIEFLEKEAIREQ